MCSSYRGFTLLILPGKVSSKSLEMTVKLLEKPQVQVEQCFPPGCRTLDLFYILVRVLEGAWESVQPVSMCLEDLGRLLIVSAKGTCGECSRSMG